jgi:membrane-bound metal-dependent hydrolase YbcI (DUF457 family)
LAALVPDLDLDGTKGRSILDIVFAAFALYMVYFSGCGGRICIPAISALPSMAIMFFAFVGAYFVLFRFFKPRHRGITHTLVACLVFGALVYLFTGLQLAIAGGIGYLSHLVADQQIKII